MRNLAFLALALAVVPAVHAGDGVAPAGPDEAAPVVHTGSDRIRIQPGMTADQIVAMMQAKGYREGASVASPSAGATAEATAVAPVEVAMLQPGHLQPTFPDRIRIQPGMTADQVEAMMNAKGYRSEGAEVQAAVAEPQVD